MSENGIIQYQGGAVMPVVNVQVALQRFQDMKDYVEGVLHANVDFGIIPGTTKNTLLKPGAEKLCWFFGLHPRFTDITHTEDWTGNDHGGEPFFYYRVNCELVRNGEVMAAADGSANSFEKKYRFRDQPRKCPACGKETIINGKAEYGGGYLCFAKKGGCGAKFKLGDKAIEGQLTGQVKNPEIADLVNTILKMAQKRALVAATLIGANASEWFTQDMEDFTDGSFTEAPVHQPPPVVKVTAPVAAVTVTPREAEIIDQLYPADAPPAGVFFVEVPELTYETACQVWTSDKVPVQYMTIGGEKLGHMADAISKKLLKHEYTDADKDNAEFKLGAIRAIVAYRAANQ